MRPVDSLVVDTGRLATHLLAAGPLDGPTVVLVHGNVSSGRFFDETIEALPATWRCIAPDLRGFGDSAAAPVDARRGLRDFSDDVASLLCDPAVCDPARPVHLVGWSLGGGVAMQLAIDHPERVASLLLLATMSPYGFGGTRDSEGTPCAADHAGSGGGLVVPEFLRRLRDHDTGDDHDLSPRRVLRRTYVKETFRLPAEREDRYVVEMLKCALGDDNYPGDATTSANWPGVAPGTRGVNNAMSPRFCDLSPVATAALGAEVVWLRGADDVIVSDRSAIDPGLLGELGRIPGWPGEQFPPQPMLGQIRSVLERRRAAGGTVSEVVFDDCGHAPVLEHPDRFVEVLAGLVERGEAARRA